MKLDIKGSIVALITPFNEDGSVNFTVLEQLLEYHIANSTDAILVLGTTGESSTMTHEEDDEVVAFTIKTVNKRVPVVVGSGSNNTAVACKKSVEYQEMGADALLVITPYYNKSNEAGMIKHFTTIADAISIPMIMYNVPGRTGCGLSEQAVATLSKHPHICGIKEASGNISYATNIARYLNDEFVMYSGNDDMITTMMALGAKGVISVLANVAPKETHDMVMDYLNGDVQASLAKQLKYLDLVHALFIEVNPIPVKQALRNMGFNVGGYRLPLYEMSDEHQAVLLKAMQEVEIC